MESKTIAGDFSARIRAVREALGLTQARMAELMGVSFASVNRWENEQSRPSKLAWEKILHAEKLGLVGLAARDSMKATTEETEDPVAPGIDFSSNPEIVRVVAEGERLTYGHLFNPTFATELSQIDPLPHQRIAVYDHMLPQTRLRFLLADDAGAGKTIMAGLYIREMLSRRLIRRIMVVPPAGLVGNWERELRTLFNLSFRIVSGGEARAGNPFAGPDSNQLIVSVDTLAGDRVFSRLQDPSVTPYDLVVFDEAHKLSARRDPDGTFRVTDRYRLAEVLAGIPIGDARWALDWGAHHLLLMTATPHMGKDFPYFCLWRLLEPEVLTTFDAFTAYPTDARNRHFIRRTKEEMVRFDGSRIYPSRISDTLSYDLTQGEVSEQLLYDRTTDYIANYYNRARILNRSAARLVMSIFQRRLASSTYALMRSFERRIERLDAFIEDIRSGKLTIDELNRRQSEIDVRYPLDETTADEEALTPAGESEGEGIESSEAAEKRALGGVVAVTLAELEREREQVRNLLELARKVDDLGQESKFDKLREVLQDPKFRDEKILVFTEHRDTLDFLVRRLEGLGFTGQVARIHGGMDYREREEQVEFFRKPASEGGATYMIGTDAAGEGINLQFCWLMVNYDIPWNPARLEQRMGRIHRYKQKHDPVFIVNLLAGKTREGRVLKTLLEKLERIRKELRSDKVFDVIGRLFEGVSLRQYMERALTDKGAAEAIREVEGALTKEQIAAIEERERRLFGDGGDVAARLPEQRASLEREELRRLLPGYVRRFLEKAAPLLDLSISGDLDSFFSLEPLKPSALDPLWPFLEAYPKGVRERLTVSKPQSPSEGVFLHPGEPVFDRLRGLVCSRFGREALAGGAFVDPYASRPYLFHLALLSIVRKVVDDSQTPATAEGLFPRADRTSEVLEYRLAGLKQDQGGEIEECPIEFLLLLKGGGRIPPTALTFAATAAESRDRATDFVLGTVAGPLIEARRAELLESLSVRENFVARGFDYQDAELAAQRARLSDKARSGDPKAKGDLTKIKDRQRTLAARRDEALARLRAEPDQIAADEVTFLAHALVLPSSDPEDRRRHDAEVEAIAVRVAWGYEETRGATVKDVSKSTLALACGLTECPGFDLLSKGPGPDERAIEVKGRAGVGDIELTENEWAKSCNLRERYWLYVVFDCGTPTPRLVRVQDPFRKLVANAKGGVIIDEKEIFAAGEKT
jgi:superfamily II DNA or RNA helicase/DNA-binding XRE family transcriptional regulator